MSHLQIAADAPVILRAAAASALVLHIGGGALGLASGAVAMVTVKGSRPHRWAGNVFFAAMLTMSGVGAIVAPMLNDVGSAFAGAITFYLVLTGWLAGRRSEVKAGRIEIVGVGLLACAMAVVGFLGLKALAAPTHSLAGVPAFAYFVIVGFSGLIAGVDLKVLLGSPLVGPRRLARHVWRMSLALAVAYMSFLAQPAAVPSFLRGSPLQWIPITGLLLIMAYWLTRLRRRTPAKALKLKSAAAAAPLEALS